MSRLADLLHAERRINAHAQSALEHAEMARACAARVKATALLPEARLQAHEAAACALRAEREALAADSIVADVVHAVDGFAGNLVGVRDAALALAKVARNVARAADEEAAAAMSLARERASAARKVAA